MALDKEELLLLGRMDGKLDGINAHLKQQDKRIDELDVKLNGRIDSIDERLREVEKKAAVAGALSGGAVAIGTALIVEGNQAVAAPWWPDPGELMAHPGEKRTQLRGLYVYQRMAMETACKKLGIPRSTANRWKQEAADHGDDWDTIRAAVALGDDNFASLSKKLLEDYLVQHQATMDQLRDAKDMSARDRADTLASMSDSFNKTMASF